MFNIFRFLWDFDWSPNKHRYRYITGDFLLSPFTVIQKTWNKIYELTSPGQTWTNLNLRNHHDGFYFSISWSLKPNQPKSVCSVQTDGARHELSRSYSSYSSISCLSELTWSSVLNTEWPSWLSDWESGWCWWRR